eukprot:360643-Chlamydomonas_euryale.AAC.14
MAHARLAAENRRHGPRAPCEGLAAAALGDRHTRLRPTSLAQRAAIDVPNRRRRMHPTRRPVGGAPGGRCLATARAEARAARCHACGPPDARAQPSASGGRTAPPALSPQSKLLPAQGQPPRRRRRWEGQAVVSGAEAAGRQTGRCRASGGGGGGAAGGEGLLRGYRDAPWAGVGSGRLKLDS